MNQWIGWLPSPSFSGGVPRTSLWNVGRTLFCPFRSTLPADLCLWVIVSMQRMSWMLPSWAPYCEWDSFIEKTWECDRNVISRFKVNSERLIIFSKVNVWIWICLTLKPRLCPRQMSSGWGNEIAFLICRLPSRVTLYSAPLEETKNGRRMVAGQRRHQDVLVAA